MRWVAWPPPGTWSWELPATTNITVLVETIVHRTPPRYLAILHALQIEQWVLMRVSPENIPEERTAGWHDDLVSLDLFVITSQRHVEKVFILSQLSKGATNIGFKVIPLETELFRGWHLGERSQDLKTVWLGSGLNLSDLPSEIKPHFINQFSWDLKY